MLNKQYLVNACDWFTCIYKPDACKPNYCVSKHLPSQFVSLLLILLINMHYIKSISLFVKPV